MEENSKLLQRVLTLTILIFLLPISTAQEMNLNINKQTFFVNDTISITAEISNPINQTLTIIGIIRSKEPGYGGMPAGITIDPHQNITSTLIELRVSESMPSGIYFAEAKLLKEGKIIDEINISFQVTTPEEIEFQLKLCKDKTCNEQTKVFYLGEEVYIDYSSEIDNLELNLILSTPSNQQTKLSLPTSLQLDEKGTYTINIELKKPGYRNFNAIEYFSIIDKPQIGTCNFNNNCEPEKGETLKTCPHDCFSPSEKDPQQTEDSILIYLILGAIIVISIIIFLKKRSKKIHNKQNEIYEETSN